jgi:hypothetical protein
MEFKSFGKIEYIDSLQMVITQKIHGTNAQIYVYEEKGEIKVLTGNRYRWLTIDDDNHGFCAFVEENKKDIIEKLGVGRHFGEWAGKGINAGEGLKEKN